MMSNVIPIVSSSPPPLEDTGGFDDWGDDDFGGFMAADHTQNQWNDSISCNKTADEVNANFSNHVPHKFSENDKIENCKSTSLSLNLEKNLPYSTNISSDIILPKEDFDDNKTSTNKADNLSGASTTDSGLFDVSPVPISEDTKSENSDDSQDAFQDTPDDIPIQSSCPNDANNVPIENVDDEVKEVAQENLVVQDNEINEGNDDCNENTECIPDDSSIGQQTNNNLSSNSTDSIKSTNSSQENGRAEIQSESDENVTNNSKGDENKENLHVTNEILCVSKTDNLSESGSEKEETVQDNDKLSGDKEYSGEHDNIPETKESIEINNEKVTDLSVVREDVNIHSTTENNTNTTENHSSVENTQNMIASDIIETSDGDDFADFSEAKTVIQDDEFADFDSEKPVKFDNESTTKSTIENETEDNFADFSEAKTVIQDDFDSEKPVKFDSESTAMSHVENETEDDFAEFSSVNPSDNKTETKKTKKQSANFESVQTLEDEDDFTDFSSTKIQEIEDDFADFTSAKVKDSSNDNFPAANLESRNETDTTNLGSDRKSDFDDDEEFADFSAAKSNKKSLSSSEDEFADFSAAVGNKKTLSDSEDEFADFSSAQNSKFTDFESNVQSDASFSQSKESDSWATFQQTSASPSKPSEPQPGQVLSSLTECYQEFTVLCEESVDLDVTVQENENQLWMKLQKDDKTSILKWSEFNASKNLFVSLKIDTKNILLGYKKPTVPIFAANLTLLEPTKGVPTVQPEVTLVNTDKAEEVKDLPPVQFDWTSSGLTNPLEGNSKLQPLDFLTVDESEIQSKSKVFDSDLIHGQRTAMQPLQNILANLKVTKKTRLEDLSNEAGRVISHLPDLSFMKAKVLMFPLKQNDL